MKYLLFYNIDELSKKILLKSYLDDGYIIASDIDNNVLVKKNSNTIPDEDIYIRILFSYIKRSEIIKECKGKILDFTAAFKYANSKNGFNKFDNRFEWYIRNIITKEIISNV